MSDVDDVPTASSYDGDDGPKASPDDDTILTHAEAKLGRDEYAALAAPEKDLTDRQKAIRRKLWKRSAQYGQAKKAAAALSVLMLFVLMAAAIVYLATNDSATETAESTDKPTMIDVLGGTAFAYIVASFILYSIIRTRLEKIFVEEILLGVAALDVREAEEAAAGEGAAIQFASLWFATQQRLNYYHKLATGQARQSFWNAQLASALGFSVLVVAAVMAGIATSPAASIAAGATGIFGGALGGYMGVTFVRMQQDASARLRAYFLQPLEFSRVLAAERLALTLTGQARDEALLTIVRSIAQSPSVDADQGLPKTKEEATAS